MRRTVETQTICTENQIGSLYDYIILPHLLPRTARQAKAIHPLEEEGGPVINVSLLTLVGSWGKLVATLLVVAFRQSKRKPTPVPFPCVPSICFPSHSSGEQLCLVAFSKLFCLYFVKRCLV